MTIVIRPHEDDSQKTTERKSESKNDFISHLKWWQFCTRKANTGASLDRNFICLDCYFGVCFSRFSCLNLNLFFIWTIPFYSLLVFCVSSVIEDEPSVASIRCRLLAFVFSLHFFHVLVQWLCFHFDATRFQLHKLRSNIPIHIDTNAPSP